MPRGTGFRCRRGGTGELRAGILGSAGKVARAAAVEAVEALVGDFQHPAAGMPHELAPQVKQAREHGGDLMALPTLAESRMLERYAEIVRDDADAEEGGIGGKMPTGHALHAKANLQVMSRNAPTDHFSCRPNFLSHRRERVECRAVPDCQTLGCSVPVSFIISGKVGIP